jgi:hypothetical protein
VVNENKEKWEKRMAVVGQAQARYLWLLLLSGIFYWALYSKSGKGNASSEVTAPVFGIELSSEVLLASAPFVIFSVITIIHGTFRAYSKAIEMLNLDEESKIEPYDVAPNPIDFAAYNPNKVSKIPEGLLLIAYPLFLSVFWVEGIYLLIALFCTENRISGYWVFAVSGAVLGIIASLLMLSFWWSRIKRIMHLIQRRPNENNA